ncbi:septal ring lytic transglycosylase RlpA family protein [Streptomyces sp. NPDC037389]|uniref:septal ring lytic transglycosylase RlpA family protein n=1 Tax=Streptomyces sp. NPDC037389 TaxID=3155369 RepID=UPI00340AC44C
MSTSVRSLFGRTLAVAALAAGLTTVVSVPAHADSEPQTCTASWYGAPGEIPPGWPTASGEPFDSEAMAAASRDLPFGTEVRVTNAENGESVTVRINDRGPTDTSRCIDLTRGAFARIADTDRGLTEVTLEVLGD